MNLFSSFLPDLVTLNPALTDFLGPFAGLVLTVLNGLAFLIIMLLVARLSTIAIRAILEFNNEKTDHQGVLGAAIRSGVEAFLIAVAGFIAISAGPNVLYYLANQVSTNLVAKETDYLPQFAGVFAPLVVSAQNLVSLGVIILGVFFGAKIWYGALSKADYLKIGPDAEGGQMGRLADAAKRSAILALLIILAFVTVNKGPQLFFEVIHGTSNLVNTPPI